VDSSIGDQLYDKATSCIVGLRQECVKQGAGAAFNAFLCERLEGRCGGQGSQRLPPRLQHCSPGCCWTGGCAFSAAGWLACWGVLCTRSSIGSLVAGSTCRLLPGRPAAAQVPRQPAPQRLLPLAAAGGGRAASEQRGGGGLQPGGRAGGAVGGGAHQQQRGGGRGCWGCWGCRGCRGRRCCSCSRRPHGVGGGRVCRHGVTGAGRLEGAGCSHVAAGLLFSHARFHATFVVRLSLGGLARSRPTAA
jgi:hypothetical protein